MFTQFLLERKFESLSPSLIFIKRKRLKFKKYNIPGGIGFQDAWDRSGRSSCRPDESSRFTMHTFFYYFVIRSRCIILYSYYSHKTRLTKRNPKPHSNER